MRRNHIIGAAFLLLAAGCGGSGSGVNSTPDPTPSPTPTPTPTPIPTGETPPELPPTTSGTLAQAYLTDQDFRTGSTEIVYDADAGTIQTRNKAYQSPTSIRIYYDAASDGYVVSNLDIGAAYDFRGIHPGADSQGNFDYYSRNETEGTRALRILRPDNSLIALTYTSFGEYQLDSSDRAGVTPQVQDNHFFYFGIPTAATDMPTTGTAHYDGIASGMLSTQDDDFDLSGAAALDVDFASGGLTTAMQLQGNGRHTANPLTLPELDGVASITSGNAFLGTISTADNSYEGSVQGAFFGPQAKEFGYSWAINSPDLTKLGGGVAVGKR